MDYVEALYKWARTKVAYVKRDTVYVNVEIDQGYQCCGGSDPLCYCSLAEDASVIIVIKEQGKEAYRERFYFHDFMEELFEASK